MIIYIAFLRGINVGGKNLIKMAELKKLFESLGLIDVKTYIQSGNIVFKSNESEDYLIERMEKEIEKAFGFYVPVVLRSSAELDCLLKNCPFSVEEISNAENASQVESIYAALLPKAPLEERKDQLLVYQSKDELCEMNGRDVYLLFYNSIRNSKLANHLTKLDPKVTVRNFKTINKVLDLTKS